MNQEIYAPVLVAEDNATNRLALKALLKRFGVEAHFVCNGGEAVEAVKRRQYKLILMDVMMPQMDGFEATRQIRHYQFSTGQHTPIVAVTALCSETSKLECITSGMDDFLSKPIDQQLLKQKLERWLLPSFPPAGKDKEETANHQPINRENIQQWYGNDDVIEILDSFLTVTDVLLDSLRQAIDAQDLSGARYMVHEVKGSSLAVSAEEMVQWAIQLENAIHTENWIEAVKTYTALTTAFTRVTECLKIPVAAVVEA